MSLGELIGSFSVAQLKDELRGIGLPVGGLKADLLARLTAALGGQVEAGGAGTSAGNKRRTAKEAGSQGSKRKKYAVVGPLPAAPSPWLSRCIQRWELVAPYDPKVTEAQWEGYYKERAALEWYTRAIMAGWLTCKEDPRGLRGQPKLEYKRGDQRDRGQPAVTSASLKWTEDFDPPLDALGDLCEEFYEDCYTWGTEEWRCVRGMTNQLRGEVQATLSGCPGVPNVASMSRLLASGMFILNFAVNFEDAYEPRTINMTTRLYAPTATGRSIDFKYEFHHRHRLDFSESFSNCWVMLRSASDSKPLEPQEFDEEGTGLYGLLFDANTEDSGRQERQFAPKTHLQDLGAWLLGSYRLLSERKAMTLAVKACGLTLWNTGEWTDYALRVTRRKHHLLPGETSDANSDDDVNSHNGKARWVWSLDG